MTGRKKQSLYVHYGHSSFCIMEPSDMQLTYRTTYDHWLYIAMLGALSYQTDDEMGGEEFAEEHRIRARNMRDILRRHTKNPILQRATHATQEKA